MCSPLLPPSGDCSSWLETCCCSLISKPMHLCSSNMLPLTRRTPYQYCAVAVVRELLILIRKLEQKTVVVPAHAAAQWEKMDVSVCVDKCIHPAPIAIKRNEIHEIWTKSLTANRWAAHNNELHVSATTSFTLGQHEKQSYWVFPDSDNAGDMQPSPVELRESSRKKWLQ